VGSVWVGRSSPITGDWLGLAARYRYASERSISSVAARS